MEIRHLLTSTDMTIKEIANMFHFYFDLLSGALFPPSYGHDTQRVSETVRGILVYYFFTLLRLFG